MLNSETSGAGRRPGQANSAPVTSQLNVVTYVRDISADLQKISKDAGLPTLAHLLSLVVLEASGQAEDLAKT